MTLAPAVVEAARRGLRAAYGLALEGLSEEQIALAVAGASGRETPDPGDPSWLARVVDQLPIDESWLFRDEGLWTWLRDEAGPALLDRAAAAARPVRILSLGCSTGQEPFSLGILFQALLEARAIPPSAAAACASIVGLDSSAARIAVARSGAVNAWSVQRCRSDWLRGRVHLEDAATGRHRVDPSVRAMCRFEVGNLLEVVEAGAAALGGYDLVLCRNVLIYFRPDDAARVAARLARGLDAGALLVLSAAEAHLLSGADGVEAAGQLGAARVAHAAVPARVRARRPARPARSVGAAALARRKAPPPPPRPARAVAGGDAAGDHVREALALAQAGRDADALRAARAALFHDPRGLLSRMLLGQQLIRLDAARGREVLRALLDQASRLPPDAEVPHAEGLSVGQLADAVRLLLARPEAR